MTPTIVKGKINLGINLDPNEFGGFFGLPPACHLSKEIQSASFPKLYLIPCLAHTEGGLDAFRMDESKGAEEYNKALQSYGITLNWRAWVPFAYLPEAPLTASLNNEYGETFLQKMTDLAGEGFGQISQIMGARSTDQLISQIRALATKGQETLSGAESTLLNLVGKMVGAGEAALGATQQLIRTSGLMETSVGRLMDKLVTNHRFDFPQIWRNSSFNQNQTLTIRLYNPRPASREAHKKYILGPLAALLLMASPRSDTAYGYNWPLFVRAVSPGFFAIKAGAISSVTIVKGGDQNVTTLTGPRISVVDIRIELINLYSAIVDDGSSPDSSLLPDKPNVATLLSVLDNELNFRMYRSELTEEEKTKEWQIPLYSSLRRSDQNLLAQKLSVESESAYAYEQQKIQERQTTLGGDRSTKSLFKAIEYEETRFVASSRIPQDKVDKTKQLIAQKEDYYLN